jgi:cell fate (sporulation/competence/biofilm development) regulator YlbF (YheA/YmcA/DUF963 family)
MSVRDDSEILVTSLDAHVDILLTEFKQAGVMPNGFYDVAFNEETRRMLWAGQSPDGRKWDENMPEGQPALPWNGCSDTRVPLVDSVVNDDTAVLVAAWRKADLRANSVNWDNLDLTSGISDYLHWLVHTKYRDDWRLEAELAAQYSREYGFAIAYIGWERELGKRRITLTLEQLQQLAQQIPDLAGLPDQITDPTQDDASAQAVKDLYRMFVLQNLQGKGFYEQELNDEKMLEMKSSLARKCVKELREQGETRVPIPYVFKNGPMVWVGKPYQEILAARGTMKLQQARAIFWRRWMTLAELESKIADGWDADWIEAVKKTQGNISSWAGALGATSLTGPSTKTVGNTTYLKVTEENNPLVEVVYGYVKKVDDDGVTGVYETIFSPHVTHDPETHAKDFCASHQLIDYAHGQYPFVEFKRENIGRALTDVRSVPEIASTWQNEVKQQRDMLYNRAQWDTMPAVAVPKLGGVDYKLGPGAQVPLGKNQEIAAINLNAPSPQLAVELVQAIALMKDDYFGQFNQEVHPAKIAVKQEKAADDYYTFWGEVLTMVFSLELQYNPEEIVRVTGNQALANLDPFQIMDDLAIGLEFDVRDLNPEYLMQKLDVFNNKIIPADVTGSLDRAVLTAYESRAVDPILTQRLIQDKQTASQKMFEEVQKNLGNMMLGFEANYVENDPTAPSKLQFLQQLIQSNPNVGALMKKDNRFKALMENYAKNLQMSVEQQQNKQIGRIGVKPMAQAPSGAATMGAPAPTAPQ